VGPSGGIAPGGGRGIITGGPVAAPSGSARPPEVWCRELWAATGPLLVRLVGSVATGGCTAADIDRSTPPSSTGRQPPEAPLPLTAGRIPPPPGSGAYGRYSSSLRAGSCNRVSSVFRRVRRFLGPSRWPSKSSADPLCGFDRRMIESSLRFHVHDSRARFTLRVRVRSYKRTARDIENEPVELESFNGIHAMRTSVLAAVPCCGRIHVSTSR